MLIDNTPTESTQLLSERYIILDYLNQGSYGQVFLSTPTNSHPLPPPSPQLPPSLNPPPPHPPHLQLPPPPLFSASHPSLYALKRLKQRKMPTPINVYSQSLQVHLLQSLPHPNMMQMTQLLHDEQDQIYIAMPFAMCLTNLAPHLSDSILHCITTQLITAVAYLHANNCIHKDITPTNIFITEEGVLQLGDYSISQRTSVPNGINTSLRYRAPELILLRSDYDERVDVWSMGCALAEISIGEPLFQGHNDISLLGSIVRSFEKHIEIPIKCEGKRKCFKEKLKGKNQKFCQLIEKMLEFDFKKRISAHLALNEPYIKQRAMTTEVEQIAKMYFASIRQKYLK